MSLVAARIPRMEIAGRLASPATSLGMKIKDAPRPNESGKNNILLALILMVNGWFKGLAK